MAAFVHFTAQGEHRETQFLDPQRKNRIIDVASTGTELVVAGEGVRHTRPRYADVASTGTELVVAGLYSESIQVGDRELRAEGENYFVAILTYDGRTSIAESFPAREHRNRWARVAALPSGAVYFAALIASPFVFDGKSSSRVPRLFRLR